MPGKVGLEEHFAIDDTISDSKGFLPERVWPELRARLLDFHDERLAEMDERGMAVMILSLNAPAVQQSPTRSERTKLPARRMTCSARRRTRRSSRAGLPALAALPMQDAATHRRFERCVHNIGFCSARQRLQVGDPPTPRPLRSQRCPAVSGPRSESSG